MQFTFSTAILIALATRSACSPLNSAPTPTMTPQPTCTLTVFREPAFVQDCTFLQHTATATSYTDCHGCALETLVLGLGLPCHAVTNVPGTATTTVTACSEKSDVMAAATPPVTPWKV
ncbi:hypothetical protein HBI56_004030 [Parastagonospora nodorum]|uniref:Uncharacterized protein n=1 Tax=Phaeosphaeria nodorum (strain SN15 / ATCC MYA-4574 / FGSC 10173) TaxID=321614 RepID=A0A7U2HX36_PHANO|nr:hypothetical protein HBH56_137020 [Parastagonospora nodorum]QRC91302.1 hypothetical protein JI435_401200 [Parastagonospora nodorum SN15]KAH3928161.1 hypothetical protein HBH54_142150 [Parastagonospora nodorum]KAH3948825.1 hypothetical protein HBH53_092130 [Parastagonospora nodorum]KAH3972531.1 hypothetical protein HBH52_153070 [Parastagonospora nodorum]